MPQDLHAFVTAVVGAPQPRHAQEPRAEQCVLGFELLDAFLQNCDRARERAAAAFGAAPVVMGQRNGASDQDEGFVHRANLAPARHGPPRSPMPLNLP